ncbi:hypothetical protein SCHPADRAFT_997231 [Schizopora paradoxa]|uniref:BTB domain-containing protein n=1 Tax=Schizopora paradoxa TaxID=27342 RepID=A0A0H2RNP1_9AGAM|nr:hypothetical protein SCHPADRAFT_997231 [Schizopora paradoxa]
MDDIPTRPVKHHEKHWIPDGSVVIGAADSKKATTTLFRIHRTLLTDQSEVFASMFSLPQGEENSQTEYYEDLPVVRLPDTSEEVGALLDVLRDPLTLESDTPERIQPALKMASKYIMTDLRAKLVHAFESEWPLKVEDLEFKDQLFIDYFTHGENGLRDDPGDFAGWPLHLVPEPASAIALAEDFDIKTVLPAAYYDLLRCAPRRDWNQFFGWPEDVYLPGPIEKPARWECLSAKSYKRMVYLQDVVVEEAHHRFEYLKGYKCKGCSNIGPESCAEAWRSLVREVEVFPDHVRERDLLKQLRDLRVRITRERFCDSCRTKYLDIIKVQRNGFWKTFQRVCWGGDYDI